MREHIGPAAARLPNSLGHAARGAASQKNRALSGRWAVGTPPISAESSHHTGLDRK